MKKYLVGIIILLCCGALLVWHTHERHHNDLKQLFGSQIEFLSWPHASPRQDKIQFLIVHSFAFDVPSMIKRLDELQLSTHYLIDKQGKIVQMVSDDRVAWHTGKSFWRGTESLNKYSIGVELQNDTLGQTPFTEAQLHSFEKLALYLMKKYDIPPENVVGHSDVAPDRKVDPGKAFPWKEMSEKGIGFWQDLGEDMLSLSQLGYDVKNPKAARLAYRRHYHPDLIPTDMDISHLEEHLKEEIEVQK